ncbi:hypothetical protein PSI19_02435 [Xenorhabdus khoisanae]|uniref:hypothetical protein n=1 Tax=Xenorhabdus khoisanae TaxID=880157 RepID=UPI002358CE59|nr:hypothetical protein [Xenorhabdus khoisanae]MDC9612757.1 hypothetical protein [Xenorhabdus khoisanae]
MSNFSTETVSLKSLILNIDSPFLAVPPSSDDFPAKIYTKVTATVRDIHGSPLSGKKIFVSSDSRASLEEIIIYDSDHTTEIKLQSGGDYEGFLVKTDQNGNILFFIHPIKSEGLKFKLFSQILGTTNTVAANYTIYIIGNTLQEIPEKYPEPEIFNSSGINLISHGESKFSVEIPDYDSPKVGDSILFFVNDKYTKYSINITDKSDSGGSLKLPYAIFEENVVSYFSYIVIREAGEIAQYKSNPLTLIYKGNSENKPWNDVDRIYDTCKVYSSGDTLIDEYDVVNDATIAESNPSNAGLFVRITGTNDPNDNSKVLFGSKVKLNLYINSSTRKITHTFTGTMPIHPDDTGGSTATLLISIDHNYLNNNMGYESGENGSIFFDYQVGDDTDIDVAYGGIWQGGIDTDPYA